MTKVGALAASNVSAPAPWLTRRARPPRIAARPTPRTVPTAIATSETSMFQPNPTAK